MSISNSLVKDLIGAVTPVQQNTNVSDSTNFGIIKTDGDELCVQLDGSDELIPLSSTVDVRDGDRVSVLIKDHEAVVNGDITSPAARDSKVNSVNEHLGIEFDENEDVVSSRVSLLGSTVEILGSTVSVQGSDIAILNSTFVIENGKVTGLKEVTLESITADDATLRNLFVGNGVLKNAVVQDGQITGELDAVTINANLIKSGTIATDRLVIVGDDGILYKLNISAGGVAPEVASTDQLNGSVIQNASLHGDKIIASSITADKLTVSDLVAFGATIANFHISENAIYSGNKNSVDSSYQGIYMGSDGQMNIGNSSNYIKYYKDAQGNYKLAIAAQNIIMGSGANVQTAIANAQTTADAASEKIALVLKDGTGLQLTEGMIKAMGDIEVNKLKSISEDDGSVTTINGAVMTQTKKIGTKTQYAQHQDGKIVLHAYDDANERWTDILIGEAGQISLQVAGKSVSTWVGPNEIEAPQMKAGKYYLNDADYIGQTVYSGSSTDVSVPNYTSEKPNGKAVASVSLPSGTWLITGTVTFPGKSGGFRTVNLSTTSGSTSYQTYQAVREGANDGYDKTMQVVHITKVSVAAGTEQTFYVNATQSSGSALTCKGWVRAVRIG